MKRPFHYSLVIQEKMAPSLLFPFSREKEEEEEEEKKGEKEEKEEEKGEKKP